MAVWDYHDITDPVDWDELYWQFDRDQQRTETENMSGRKPIGRLTAREKNKDGAERIQLGTFWPPNREGGAYGFSLGMRKQVNGEWVTIPVRVVVEDPDGEFEVQGESFFLDAFMDLPTPDADTDF